MSGFDVPDRRELVSSGRHKAEPVRSARPRLPLRLPVAIPRNVRNVPRPVVAVGVGVTLVGVALGVVTMLPGGGSDPQSQAVLVADGQREAALAAQAVRAAAAEPRIEERVSRDRSPDTSAPASVTPVDALPSPDATPEVVGKLWVRTSVNVRSGPSADEDKVTTLKAATKVGVTGTTKGGWTQVVTDEGVGWVKSSFLSKSKPTAAVRTVSGVSNAPCSISSSIEVHLKPNARAVYRAVCAAYGSKVKSFGGYRAGDDGDHGTGRAVDIMVSGQPGTEIARYVQTHAKALGVTYVIYQQRIWMAGDPAGRWKFMADRGGATANHYDHVHVSVR
jgi:uncharacterized protein YraI